MLSNILHYFTLYQFTWRIKTFYITNLLLLIFVFHYKFLKMYFDRSVRTWKLTFLLHRVSLRYITMIWQWAYTSVRTEKQVNIQLPSKYALCKVSRGATRPVKALCFTRVLGIAGPFQYKCSRGVVESDLLSDYLHQLQLYIFMNNTGPSLTVVDPKVTAHKTTLWPWSRGSPSNLFPIWTVCWQMCLTWWCIPTSH